MSKTVDERVVSMQFDNTNFERNVQTSMNTLDKLKSALNFDNSSKGLENVSKAASSVDMSGLSSSVEQVKLKFSALEVMGITALQNIANKAINTAENVVSMFTVDPVSSGFSEYELKMGSIQTIMASTGASLSEVNGYLDELNVYADKTIYSFADMTNNIGKFTNAGVNLKDAVLAIQGISNEAAVSGANTNEASRAMYNFAQALSAGYVKLIDWKSIENANMATVEFKNELLESAEALGTIKKQSDGTYRTVTTNAKGAVMRGLTATKNFNDSLSYQWMTTDVLVKTLGKYADETTDIGKKAFAAAQDVKTFSMMMDTLKEAAGSGWTTTWEIIIGDFEEAKEFWTDLTNVFSGAIEAISTTRNTILEGALGSNWSNLSAKITDAGLSLNTFEKELKKTAKQHGVNVNKMIKESGSFEASLKKGWLSADIVTETLKRMSTQTSKSSASTEDLNKKLKKFQKVVNQVWNGDYKNGEARVKALTKAGYNYNEVQTLVNKTVDGHKLTLKDLSKSQLKAVGYTDKEIKKLKELAAEAEKSGTSLNRLIQDLGRTSGRDLLIGSIQNVLTAITKIVTSIRDAWYEVFSIDDQSSFIYDMISAFHDFTNILIISDKDAKKLKKTFKGLFSIVKTITTLVRGAFNTAFSLIGALLGNVHLNVLDLTSAVGEAAIAFSDWVTNDNVFLNQLLTMSEALIDMVATVVKWGDSAVQAGVKWASSLIDIKSLNTIITKTNKMFEDFTKTISKNISVFTNWVKKNNFINTAMTNFTKVMSTSISTISKWGSVGYQTVVKWADTFLKLEDVKDLLGNINDFFTDLKNSIVDFFSGNIIGNVKTFIESLVGANKTTQKTIDGLSEQNLKLQTMGISTSAIVSGFSTITKNVNKVNNVSEYFNNFCSSISNGLSNFYNQALSYTKPIMSEMTSFTDGIVKLLTVLKSKLPNIGLGEILTTFLGASLVSFIITMGKAVNALTQVSITIGNSIAGIFNAVKTVVAGIAKIQTSIASSLTKLADSAKKTADAQAFKTVAEAVAILAGALILLAQVPMDKLKGAATILGAVAIGIMALTIASSYMAKTDLGGGLVVNNAALTIIGIAVALGVLTLALNKLAEISIADLAKGVTVILALVGALIAMLYAINKFGAVGSDLESSATSLLILAAAMWVLSKAVASMSGIDAKTMITSLFLLGELLGTVIVVAKLGGTVTKEAAAILLSSAASLLLIAIAIRALGTIKGETALKGIAVMYAVFIGYAGLMVATKLAGKYAAQAGVMLLALSASLILMAVAIKMMGMVKESELDKTISVIAKMMLVFGAVVALSNFAGKYAARAGVMIMLMAGSLLILSFAIAILSYIDPDGLDRATSAIAKLELVFGAVIALSHFANGNATLTISKIALCLGILGVALGILSMINADGLERATTALVSVMASLALVFASMGLIPDSCTKTVGLMALLLAEMAGIIYLLSDLPADNVLPNVLALDSLLISLSASMFILSAMKSSVNATTLGLVAILAAIVVALGVALGLLAKYNLNANIETAASLSILIVSLSYSLMALATIGNYGTFAGALEGIGSLVALIAAIVAVATALGAINAYWSDFDKFVNGGFDILEAVGNGIGRVIGAFIGGIGEGITDTLPRIAQNLTDFMLALQPFILMANNLKGDILENVKTLAEAILILAGADFIDGLLNFVGLGSDSEDIVTKLVALGTAMVQFSKVTENLDPDSMSKVADAAKSLAEVQNALSTTGGFKGFMLGDKDLGAFGDNLTNLGEGLSSFSKSITGENKIDPEAISTAAEAIKPLAEISSSLNNQGNGWLTWLTGSSDLGAFGENLTAFGTALTGFSSAVSEKGAINPSAIATACEASKTLFELNDLIPEGQDKGFFAKLFGSEDNFSTFGGNLTNFGTALTDFSTRLGDTSIDTSAITSLCSIVKDSLMPAIEAATSVNLTGATNFQTAANNLVDAIKKIQDLGTIDITNFVDSIKSLAGLTFDTSSLQTTSAQVAGSVSSMVTSIKNSVSGAKSGIKTSMSTAMAGIPAGINAGKASAITAMQTLMNAVGKVVSDYSTTLSTKTKTISGDAATAAKDKQSSFESTGKYLAQGLIVGMDKKLDAVKTKAAQLAKAAAEAMAAATEVSSPSKVTTKLGEYIAAGLVVGMDNMSDSVADAGYSVGDTATKSISNAVSRISDMMNSDIDAQPTIRPVVDLSNVSESANSINSMFSSTKPSVGVLGQVSSISSAMNANQNRATNDDVVYALNKLGKALNSSSGDTYNINGVTYDDGSNISSAVQTLVNAARVERRR